MYVVRLFALAGCVAAAAAAAAAAFSWPSIAPSVNLTYHPCYTSFECARLSVPIDYSSSSSSSNHTTHLALIKLPAAGNASTFGGTLFLNPGGPGASGVSFLRNWGDYIRYIVDKPGVKNYELVSFDPRGIANSWPRADCFDDMTERQAVARELRAVKNMFLNENQVGYQSLAHQSLGHFMSLQAGVHRRCELAEMKNLPGERIMAHMSTSNTARDLLRMVDKVEAHRNGTNPAPRLQYMGFSQGSVLGSYFASMFPGRVDKMVLDGVLEVQDYRAKQVIPTPLKPPPIVSVC